MDFADYHSLVLADIQFGDSVGWTFESHSSLSHSWIDHELVSSRIASAVSKVSTVPWIVYRISLTIDQFLQPVSCT